MCATHLCIVYASFYSVNVSKAEIKLREVEFICEFCGRIIFLIHTCECECKCKQTNANAER